MQDKYGMQVSTLSSRITPARLLTTIVSSLDGVMRLLGVLTGLQNKFCKTLAKTCYEMNKYSMQVSTLSSCITPVRLLATIASSLDGVMRLLGVLTGLQNKFCKTLAKTFLRRVPVCGTNFCKTNFAENSNVNNWQILKLGCVINSC